MEFEQPFEKMKEVHAIQRPAYLAGRKSLAEEIFNLLDVTDRVTCMKNLEAKLMEVLDA